MWRGSCTRTSAAFSKVFVERLLDAFEAQHPDFRVVRLRPAFVFQRPAATEQRRIFGGALLPGALLRPGQPPVLPDVATDPVVDGTSTAKLVGARVVVPVPRSVARIGLSAAP